jgi:methylamine dehydrogenase heavy chain
MMTLSLDETGQLKGKTKSEKFFDVDDDALFVPATREGNTYHFISFKGRVIPVDVSGDTARPGSGWTLVSDSDRKRNWRPSGYQLSALHNASGTLYVQMHANGREGTHKNPGEEIWVYDVALKKRVGRVKAEGAVSLSVSQGENPRLFAVDPEHGAVVAYDGLRKLRKVLKREGLGEASTQIETQ